MHFSQLINDFYHKINSNPNEKFSLDVQWVLRIAFTDEKMSCTGGAGVEHEASAIARWLWWPERRVLGAQKHLFCNLIPVTMHILTNIVITRNLNVFLANWNHFTKWLIQVDFAFSQWFNVTSGEFFSQTSTELTSFTRCLFKLGTLTHTHRILPWVGK